MMKKLLYSALSVLFALTFVACGNDSTNSSNNNGQIIVPPPFYPNNPNNNGQWKSTWAQYNLAFSDKSLGGKMIFYSPTNYGSYCLLSGKYAYGYQYYTGPSSCEYYGDWVDLYVQLNTQNQMRIVIVAKSAYGGQATYSSPVVNIDDSYNNSQGFKLTFGPTWNNMAAPTEIWDEHGIAISPVASPTAKTIDLSVAWGVPGQEQTVLSATLNKIQ